MVGPLKLKAISKVGDYSESEEQNESQRARWGFLFVLPWLLGFIFFFFIPLLDSLRYSFSSIKVNSNGMDMKFVGFKNYIEALTVNTSFNRTLIESIMDMLVNVPLI